MSLDFLSKTWAIKKSCCSNYDLEPFSGPSKASGLWLSGRFLTYKSCTILTWSLILSAVQSLVSIGGRNFTDRGVGRRCKLPFLHARWVPVRTIGTIGRPVCNAKWTKPCKGKEMNQQFTSISANGHSPISLYLSKPRLLYFPFSGVPTVKSDAPYFVHIKVFVQSKYNNLTRIAGAIICMSIIRCIPQFLPLDALNLRSKSISDKQTFWS